MKLRVIQALIVLHWLFLSQVYAQTKIVGGVESAPGTWPSTVALLSKSTVEGVEAGLFVYSGTNTVIPATDANYQAQVCGGSLIDQKWVLTAAHCVVSESGVVTSADALYALVGTSDLLSGGTRLAVKSIVVHSSYNPATADSDIALLELENSVVGIETVGAMSADPLVGTIATVVGWGDMTASDLTTEFPTKLNEVDLPVVSRVECANVYGTDLTDNMFCAGYEAGGKDSCQGDSGGPLFVSDGGIFKQAGIVSWGYGCAQAGIYGIYTRLSQFTTWIDTVKSGGSFTPYTPPSMSSGGGGGAFWFGFPLFILLLLGSKLIIGLNKGN